MLHITDILIILNLALFLSKSRGLEFTLGCTTFFFLFFLDKWLSKRMEKFYENVVSSFAFLYFRQTALCTTQHSVNFHQFQPYAFQFLLQVPLGNFELDWLIYTADTFFSRALRDKQQVLVSFPSCINN